MAVEAGWLCLGLHVLQLSQPLSCNSNTGERLPQWATGKCGLLCPSQGSRGNAGKLPPQNSSNYGTMPVWTPVLSKQLLAKMPLEIKLDEARTVCGRDLDKTELEIGREPWDKKITKNFQNNCVVLRLLRLSLLLWIHAPVSQVCVSSARTLMGGSDSQQGLGASCLVPQTEAELRRLCCPSHCLWGTPWTVWSLVIYLLIFNLLNCMVPSET